MKQLTFSILTLFVTLCIVSPLLATTFYSHRSFNQAAPQVLINYGTTAPYELNTSDCINHTLIITPLYTHTVQRDKIVCSLFGDDLFPFNGRDVIRVSGSRVEERGEKDWLADYFGLRQDFASFLSFEPFIENIVFDFEWHAYLAACPQWYARIRSPLVHTQWSIELIEHSVQTSCDTEYPPGYFADASIFYQDIENDLTPTGPVGIPCRQLNCAFKQYISDCLVPNLVTANNATIFEPLQFSKMSRDQLVKTHLDDIQVAVGYTVLERPCGQLSVEALLWFPTGNRPEGHFIFEPVVGNGHHWQVGVGLLGDLTLLQNNCTDKELILYGYGYVAHPFSTRQVRTFDLCNSANSRYMLAQKMGTPVTNLLLNGSVPSAQFKGIFTPVANLTTFDVDVSVNWQADVALMVQYRSRNFYMELGYNYWGRACESISFTDCCPVPFECDTWSLKGDSFVYGFVPDDAAEPDIANMPIALSSTQSQSTIHAGTTRFIGAPPLLPADRNAGVDNPELATLPDLTLLLTGPLLAEDPDDQQRSSLNPIFLTQSDINLCSAQTKGRSHTFFAHLGYTWSEHCPFVPSLGIGFMVELASANRPSDNRCTLATPSQLGIWLKGGFSF